MDVCEHLIKWRRGWSPDTALRIQSMNLRRLLPMNLMADRTALPKSAREASPGCGKFTLGKVGPCISGRVGFGKFTLGKFNSGICICTLSGKVGDGMFTLGVALLTDDATPAIPSLTPLMEDLTPVSPSPTADAPRCLHASYTDIN